MLCLCSASNTIVDSMATFYLRWSLLSIASRLVCHAYFSWGKPYGWSVDGMVLSSLMKKHLSKSSPCLRLKNSHKQSFDPHWMMQHLRFPDRHSLRCRRQVRRQSEQIGPRLPRLTLAFLLLDNIVQSSECGYPSYPPAIQTAILHCPPPPILQSSNPCFAGPYPSRRAVERWKKV